MSSNDEHEDADTAEPLGRGDDDAGGTKAATVVAGGSGAGGERPQYSTKKSFREQIPPLPFAKWLATTVVLTVLLLVPVVAFIWGFSALGSGPATYRWAHRVNNWAYACTVTAMIVPTVLYLCDAFLSWTPEETPKLCAMRKFMLITCAVLLVIAGITAADVYAYAPICIFLVGFPVYIGAIWRVCYPDMVFKQFLGLLINPLLLCGLVAFVWWVVWISLDVSRNTWCKATQIRIADASQCRYIAVVVEEDACAAGDTSIDDVANTYLDYSGCLNAFMLWVAPLVASLSSFGFAGIACILEPGYQSAHSHISPKTLGSMLSLLVLGMWCASSLAGAGTDISEAFMALGTASMMATCMLVIGTYGVTTLRHETHENPFLHQIIKKYSAYADVLRGMFVVTSMPIALGFLLLSFFNQLVRKASFVPYTKKFDNEDEKKMRFTVLVQNMLNQMKMWRWTLVLKYSMIWGIAYVSMQVVVSKFTVVFLSWLIETTTYDDPDTKADERWGLGAVTGLIIGVGLFLFLLPPVPGVPIYLFGGILLTAAGGGLSERAGDDDADDGTQTNLGIVPAIIYTNVVSICIKLCACTIQQKVFGVLLGKNVFVRQVVGVNSQMIKTMKLILGKPGFGVAKVAILVGGPDWPTSVLCGIMGLPLAPVLLGTLPVWFLILPTVLAGAFMYLEKFYSWAGTLATIFIFLVGTVQCGSLVVAGYYLERAMDDDESKRIVAEMPIDEEVAALDRISAQKAVLYDKLTDWHTALSGLDKGLLAGSVALMIMSCYLLTFYTTFVPYELTDNFSCDPLNGDATNVLLPWGKTALVMFCLSCALFFVFVQRASRRVERERKAHGDNGAAGGGVPAATGANGGAEEAEVELELTQSGEK